MYKILIFFYLLNSPKDLEEKQKNNIQEDRINNIKKEKQDLAKKDLNRKQQSTKNKQLLEKNNTLSKNFFIVTLQLEEAYKFLYSRIEKEIISEKEFYGVVEYLDKASEQKKEQVEISINCYQDLKTPTEQDYKKKEYVKKKLFSSINADQIEKQVKQNFINYLKENKLLFYSQDVFFKNERKKLIEEKIEQQYNQYVKAQLCL